MTRAKVYGEDVKIRLLSEDTSTPLILDFDMCDIASLRQNKMYKAIGKRVSKPHSVTSGYKITLTRAKRDNYLEALTQYLDFFIERGLDFPTFTIERTVFYQYDKKELNSNAEFFQSEIKQNNSNTDFLEAQQELKRRAEFIKEATARKNDRKLRVLSAMASNYLPKAVDALKNSSTNSQKAFNSLTQKFEPVNNLITNALKITSDISNYNKALQGVLSDFNNELEVDPLDTPEYKKLLEEIKKHNNFEVFQSKILYKNCTIVEETFTDKPKEVTEEKFILYSSNRINVSDINEYEDKYLSSYFTNMEKERNARKSDLILKGSENISKSNIGSALNQLVKLAYQDTNGDNFVQIFDSGK